ncbi:MAG: glycine cleavage system protein GcvH [Lentisphaerae bacterium]|nr:glycine cleavage system protein GcvH [Lentisphaerota bacterium]
MTPEDRKYVKSHEWIKMENETAVVGITDHAQEALGDITFVELPATGETIEQGHECGVIESVKAASDIYAPVTGEVAEVNTELETKPEIINEDPYGKGWIFKMTGVPAEQYEDLLDSAEYEHTIDEDD